MNGGSGPRKEELDLNYDNYGGSRTSWNVFMENEENLNSVLKDVLNVSIDC